jgi:hypothetical protein
MFEILKYIPSLTENRSESRDKSQLSFLFRCGSFTVRDRGLNIRAGRHQLTLPVLASLSRRSTSASSEVRHAALSSLSRAILGPLVVVSRASASNPENFERVLYALLVAPVSMETTESRLRASVLSQ